VAVAETAGGAGGGGRVAGAWRERDGIVTEEVLVTEIPRTSLFLPSSSDVAIT
jgi:hypothetical protein